MALVMDDSESVLEPVDEISEEIVRDGVIVIHYLPLVLLALVVVATVVLWW